MAFNAREKYSGKLIGLRNVEVIKITESLNGVPQDLEKNFLKNSI
jgi:hypothetical protein